MTQVSFADATPQPETAVLIVDDHRMVADALRMRMLAATGDAPVFAPVDTAYGLGMARAMLNRRAYDVVLLDDHLGEEWGTALFPTLAALDPAPLTLMLSAGSEPARVIEALRHASGWVAKDISFDQLVHAIEVTGRGETYVAPRLLGPVLEQLLRQAGHTRAPCSFVDKASVREREVLECLVRGMTRREVAEHLFISTNTVRTHVQSLLRHAGVHSTIALIAAARAEGVAQGPPLPSGPGRPSPHAVDQPLWSD